MSIEVILENDEAVAEVIPDFLKGDKGDTGYAPIRGTDYWTTADKQEIINNAVTELTPIINAKVEATKTTMKNVEVTSDLTSLVLNYPNAKIKNAYYEGNLLKEGTHYTYTYGNTINVTFLFTIPVNSILDFEIINV